MIIRSSIELLVIESDTLVELHGAGTFCSILPLDSLKKALHIWRLYEPHELDAVGAATFPTGTPSLSQKCCQKRSRLVTTSPETSMHPSNQFSQETLQLGRNARFPSIMMYFGCITLNGGSKTLLILISRLVNLEGRKPKSCSQHGDAYEWYEDADLAKMLCSVWWRPVVEKERETRTLRLSRPA